MAKRETVIALFALAGAGLALYSMSADSATLDTSGDDSGGDADGLFPLLTSAGPVQTSGDDSGDLPPPGPDFGLDTMTTTNWKVNDYPKYASAISQAEGKYGIPADLLGRVLYQESRYRPDIIAGVNRSPVGAVGIAQFMPATAQQYGLTVNGSVDQRTDPFASINAAGAYLAALYRQFGGWQNALGAYNWGPGSMTHYLDGDTDPRTGEPYALPQETETYIAQVTADIPSIA